ncbi:putative holin-like toxin [Carnobacterium sp. CS13]|nr:putative holin-like toxin [Carnobacterium sp. CS13]
MEISAEILERRSLLSVAESLQFMIGFGSLLISLISLVVVLITQNNDKKITVY